ncbi:TIGR04282 family arsenosugar biosynthesis glycosyltransferase [Methylomonas sp. MgM2]
MQYQFSDSVLLVFCKAPVRGQVKTRLQPALSAEQAVSAHIRLTELTLARAFEAPLCQVRLYCSPDTEHPFFKQCARDYPLTLAAQHGNDLGERMLHAFSDALSIGRHAILTGCDCPSLSAGDLRSALLALKNGCDAVFAPAADGGYVLVGLNEPQPTLFRNMVWGNQNVMTETRIRASRAKLKVYELPEQWDVDDFEGWRRYLDVATCSQNPTYR